MSSPDRIAQKKDPALRTQEKVSFMPQQNVQGIEANAFNFGLWHGITATLVFLSSLTLYFMTMAPTTSFWDCGEFIASSYSLSVPHPPGAPFFLMLGRLFTMVPLFEDIGARVNFISVLTSALTVLLLYLTTVHLIRYWKPRESMGWQELAGAAIGALAFMATDTFWFNAVEAEVYAISMLFTALVVWLAFVWHQFELRQQHDGDRILLLIFYIIGLAIGVHLLNVLALPMVFLVVYFHWQEGKPFRFEHFLLYWGLGTLSILPFYPGIVLWLPKFIKWLESVGGHWSALVGLLALLGVLAALHVVGRNKGNRPLALASAGLLLAMLGYLSYVLIFLRSGLNPPLDENDPQTLSALISYLSREQYGTESIVTQLLSRKADFLGWQIGHMYVRYFNWNFIGRDMASGAWNLQLLGLPLLVGLWGLGAQVAKDWKRAFTVANLFLLTGLAIVVYLNQENPQPRERDYAYVGSYYAFALWIGLGAWVLIQDLGKAARKWATPVQILAAIALFALLPLHMTRANYFVHDRSGNFVAQDYARNALATLEEGAILFTNGDNDTFPLWYLQIVEGFRTDVRVVNLSLLNTGWYVKQLRDEAPTVPLAAEFTDTMIAESIDGTGDPAFQWRYWGADLWTGTELPPFSIPMRTADGQSYLIQVPPVMAVPLGDGSNERNFLRVQDRMILEIVRANNWKRPIYFAVTTSRDNFVGLDRNLRMDGLAYRVMDRPQRENAVDTDVLGAKLDIMEKNLRGLDDSGVYYDDNIQKLVQNYRSAFIQQAMELDANKQRALALKTLSRMDKALPETVVPSVSPMLTMQLGLLFERLGDAKALRSRLEIQDPAKLSQEERFYLGSYWISPLGDLKRGLAVLDSLASEDASQQVRLQTAAVLESLGKENKEAMAAARARYEAVLKFQPDQPEAVGGLIRVLEAQGDYAAAIRSVEAWLKLSPNDPGALDKLARLRALAAGKPLPAATEEQAATTP